MKKLLAIIFIAIVGVCILGPTAEAISVLKKPAQLEQVIYGAYCCDAAGYHRCVINASPIGSQCFCYGQGYGYTCL